MGVTLAEDRPIARVSSYEQYAEREDWDTTELWDGEVFVSPPPSESHQGVLANLVGEMYAYLRSHDLGELRTEREVLWKDLRVLRPDLLFVRKERGHILRPQLLTEPPDLVVEILSPGTRSARRDREEKPLGYAQIGVPYYWIVDPLGRTVEEWTLEEGRYRLSQQVGGADTFRPALFPGWELPLSALWRGLPTE